MNLHLNPVNGLLSAASAAARRCARFMSQRRQSLGRNTQALAQPAAGLDTSAVAGVLPACCALAPVAPAPAEAEGLLLTAGACVEAAPTQDGIHVDLRIQLAWHVINVDAWALCGPQQTALLVATAQRQMLALLAETGLAALLIEREAIEARLQQALRRSTADWGLSVELVVLREVDIPVGLQIEADLNHLSALRQCMERRRSTFC